MWCGYNGSSSTYQIVSISRPLNFKSILIADQRPFFLFHSSYCLHGNNPNNPIILLGDFIALLSRLKRALKPGGIIVIKDNVGGEGCELDSEDSSVMRNNDQLEEIFRLAGVNVLQNQLQIGFPQDLQPVRLYALQ